MSIPSALEGFEATSFSAEGTTRTVYRRGDGPGVVVAHEIPGITPEVARFARRVADAGFSVYLPELFGATGREFSFPYMLGSMARACISREYAVLARRESSPVTDWLRALCRHAHGERGGPGVGFIGMCLTGNFGLSMMVDESVMAPVLSQPSLPFPVSADHKRSLHLSDSDLEVVRKRAASGCPVLGLRFSHDPMCPGERFERLGQELGNAFESIVVDSGPDNPQGIPRSAHSVVTQDLVDDAGHPTRQALDRVLGFFTERLRPS